VRGRRLMWLACAAVAGAALGVPVGLNLATGTPTSNPASAIEHDVVRDDPAPGLAGPTLAGRQFNLKDWHGHVVVVGVWASWCDPCRTELRHLADASNRWSSQGLRVVTLNIRDDLEAARSLLAEVMAADLPTVADPGGAIALAWGVRGLPQTFLVDQSGSIRLQRFGPVTPAWLAREIPALLSS
jgi:cytochrome c biogenesis protein CcmG, thiol:disulfide interchange protein DsbE